MKELVAQARKRFLTGSVDVPDPSPNGFLALTQPIDTVIAHTDVPHDRRHVLESNFNNGRRRRYYD